MVDVSDNAGVLRNEFDDCFSGAIGDYEFLSKLEGIVSFPTIIDPSKGVIPDSVRYKRGERAIFTSTNLDHGAFKAADAIGRINLFTDAVKRSFLQIPEKHLPQADREYLISRAEMARVELLARRGVTAVRHEARSEGFDGGIEEDEAPIQLVLQWPEHLPLSSNQDEGSGMRLERDRTVTEMIDVASIEDFLEEQAEGAFLVDGHDRGSGTTNIFLLTSDPDAAIAKIITLYEMGRLRCGMRVGLQSSGDDCGASYRPVYPKGLKAFDVLAGLPS